MTDRNPQLEPGDRIVFVAGAGAWLGRLVRRNTEYRNDYWFVDWEDGQKVGHSHNEALMYKVVPQ